MRQLHSSIIYLLCRWGSVEQFWTHYRWLKRPSALTLQSDYHLFKEGIKPMWEVYFRNFSVAQIIMSLFRHVREGHKILFGKDNVLD